MSEAVDQDTQETRMHPVGLLSVKALSERVEQIHNELSMDDVLTIRGDVQFLTGQITEAVKFLKQNLDEACQRWIEANGAIQCGTKRLYVGPVKNTKCRALPAAVKALLDSVGGDFDQFCECLSSGALKYGACKQVMGEETWAQHFEVTEKSELKEGVATPVKVLHEVDEQFLPKKRSK